MPKIDISGISKKILLRELWKNSKSASFFTVNGIPSPPLEEKDIDDRLNEMDNGDHYIDYFCGRAIKMSLGDNEIDSGIYDEYNGEGSVQRIVKSIREGNIPTEEEAKEEEEDGIARHQLESILKLLELSMKK